MLKKIEQGKWQELVAAFMAWGQLYAPVKDGGRVDFQLIRPQDRENITLDFYNTSLSPKAVFFPQSEDMITYRTGRGEPLAEPRPLPDARAVLLGVRPPDAQSFIIMDELFLGGGIVDPYWQRRREMTVVIGYPFTDEPADPADFYRSLGIGAADNRGSDVFLLRHNGNLFFQGLTEKGNSFLAEMSPLAEATAGETDICREMIRRGETVKTRFMECEPNQAAEVFERIFSDTAFWEKTAEACISCGTCTFVCPTCHCFDIADETTFRDGVRRRFWDACMFTDFTLEASGHNPRTKIYQRLRQKVCHKYSYYVRKFGVVSCVGCGRCTRSCPVNIDIFSIVAAALKR